MKLKESFKRIRQSKTFKTSTAVFVSALIASMFCLSCFATDGATSMEQVNMALGASFDTMAGDLGQIIVDAVPPAVGCTALYVAVRKGITFFTSLAKHG